MLTTALDSVPLFILPLLEKIGLAQRRMAVMPCIGLMMPGIMLEVLLVGVIAGKTTHNTPEHFELAEH